jgi:hypothetical protein
LRHAALPVVVADQQIQSEPREDVIEAVGVLADAAMDIDSSLLAVAGELSRQLDDIPHGDVADGAPLFERLRGRRLPQNLESALDSYPLDRRIYKEIALDGVGRIIGIERHGLAVLKDDEAIFVGEPKLFGSQELLGSAVYDLHQPTRVRPGGLFVGDGCGLVGVAEIFCVIAFVLDDPADHREG